MKLTVARPALRSVLAAPIAALLLSGCAVEFRTADMPPAAAPPAAAPPASGATTDFSPTDRLITGAIIRDYIDHHPESVWNAIMAKPSILDEARQKMAEMQQQELEEKARPIIHANTAALFDNPHDAVLGNPQGDVTIVEFFDNQCPVCRGMAPVLDSLIEKDSGVRLVLKEYPIIDAASGVAAQISLASKLQGQEKFAALHKALMADRTPEHALTEAHVLQLAASVGLNVKKLQEDMKRQDIHDQITDSVNLARKLGSDGTPTLIIGDSMIVSGMPLPALMRRVQAARTHKEAAN